MAFNPDPNKQANEVLFSCKNKAVDHPPILFNGHPVVQVKETKHLGLVLHCKLTFEKHLTEKIKKAKKINWYDEALKQPPSPENIKSNVQIPSASSPGLL